MTAGKHVFVFCLLMSAWLSNAAEVAVGDWVVSTTEGRIQIVYRDWEIIRGDEINLCLDVGKWPACSLYPVRTGIVETVSRGDAATIMTLELHDAPAGLDLTRVITVKTNGVQVVGTVTVLGRTGTQQCNMVGLDIPIETFPGTNRSFTIRSKESTRTAQIPAEEGHGAMAWYVDALAWTNEGVAFNVTLDQPSAGINTNWPSLTQWALIDRRKAPPEGPRFKLNFGTLNLQSGDKMQYGYTVHAMNADH